MRPRRPSSELLEELLEVRLVGPERNGPTSELVKEAPEADTGLGGCAADRAFSPLVAFDGVRKGDFPEPACDCPPQDHGPVDALLARDPVESLEFDFGEPKGGNGHG